MGRKICAKHPALTELMLMYILNCAQPSYTIHFLSKLFQYFNLIIY